MAVVWLPKTRGKPIRITSVNGVNVQLDGVSKEIDALPDKIKRATEVHSDSETDR